MKTDTKKLGFRSWFDLKPETLGIDMSLRPEFQRFGDED